MIGFKISTHTLFAVLLAAAIIPYFVNLGVSSIWDANEAFYAQTPREMMEADDYVTPSFNFQLRMNKPVLSYWNVAASYHLFGVSEWSERLPIAIGGLVIIATAFALGRLLGGTLAGLLAALVLATSPRVLLLARRIIIDIHLTMWTGLVLLFFALSESRPDRRRVYLCLMYVSAGFGVLTKGPVAVFLPAVVFFLYLASQKRLGDLRRMMVPVGAIISLAIVVPWYYFLYREHGWEVHRRVHIRGEPRPLRRGGRRTIARPAVLSPGDARRPVSLVVDDPTRPLVGRSRRAQESCRAPAARLDSRDCGLLLAVRHKRRPLCSADRGRRGGAGGCDARTGDRRRSRDAAGDVGLRADRVAAGCCRYGADLDVCDGKSLFACRRDVCWCRRGRGRRRRARLVHPASASRVGGDARRQPGDHRVVRCALLAARFRAVQAGAAVFGCHSHPSQHRRHRGMVQVRASKHGVLPPPAGDGGGGARSSARRVSFDERRGTS